MPDVALALAASLCRAAGRAEPAAAAPLLGGRNNRVFRIGADDGPSVLKIYHRDPRDPRDRLGAEWDFLAYAADRGVGEIPRPLACDRDAGAALISYVPGRRLSPSELGPDHLRAALDFLKGVNASPRGLDRLRAASEACFSLAEHERTVAGRVARLQELEAAGARRLVDQRLAPAWERISSRLRQAAETHRLEFDRRLQLDEVCLSPSDFGFHNALVDGARVTFLDFEYAGVDDPAKLVCDTFCQPDLPPPIDAFESFASEFLQALGLDEPHLARCRILLDLYRLKWACILLNGFLPVGAARRAFAAPSDAAAAEAQLERAHRALDLIDA